jgi:hypothetical protein
MMARVATENPEVGQQTDPKENAQPCECGALKAY